MFSLLDDPEHWLSQEREARSAAQAASHPKAREFLLRIAEDCRKRAVKSEARRKRARLDSLPAELAAHRQLSGNLL